MHAVIPLLTSTSKARNNLDTRRYRRCLVDQDDRIDLREMRSELACKQSSDISTHMWMQDYLDQVHSGWVESSRRLDHVTAGNTLPVCFLAGAGVFW